MKRILRFWSCIIPGHRKKTRSLDFMVAHFNEGVQLVGKEEVCAYLIGLNNSYIIQLCKKGDPAYRDRLKRVGEDLKEVYSGITFGSLSVLEAITLLSDATYYLYKHDEGKFFENMDNTGRFGRTGHVGGLYPAFGGSFRDL